MIILLLLCSLDLLIPCTEGILHLYLYILDTARVPPVNSVVFFFIINAIVTLHYSYSTSQLLITNPIFQDEIITYNINL
jgi:hypothetical protein